MTLVFLIDVIFAQGWPILCGVIFLLSAAIYFFLRDQSRRTTILRRIAGMTITLFLLRAVLLTYATYSLWSYTVPSKYLLPPYQPISYFLQYSFFHFFISFFLALALGFVVGGILFFLKFRRPDLLMPGDLALFVTGVLLVRWPMALLYIGALFLGGILLLLLQRYIIRGEEKFVFSVHILFWILPFLFFGNELIVFLGMSALVMPL